MRKKNLEGFTLIEAVLTFAIGGLIFSFVFLALPGIFASARDGERRDDVLFVVNKLKNFQANNNRGALPKDKITQNGLLISGDSINFGPTTDVTWKDFYAGFFDDSFRDPSGSRYDWMIVNCETKNAGETCTNSKYQDFLNSNYSEDNPTMFFVIGSSCSGDTAVATPNNRMVSVSYKLERAGFYCVNT